MDTKTFIRTYQRWKIGGTVAFAPVPVLSMLAGFQGRWVLLLPAAALFVLHWWCDRQAQRMVDELKGADL